MSPVFERFCEMKPLIVIAALARALAGGCNTARAGGDDIEKAGETIREVAE